MKPQNTVHLDVIGPTFTKTVASEHWWHGRTTVRRTGSSDSRDLLRLADENAANLVVFDRYGRPEWQPASGHPSVAVQSAAGSGAKATVAGTDVAGQVSVATGSAPKAGVLAVVSFAHAWASPGATAPRVVLQPSNAAAAGLGATSTEAPTTAHFSVRPVGTPAASTTYTWDFVAVG